MGRTLPLLVVAVVLSCTPSALASGPFDQGDEGPDPPGITIVASAVARVVPPARLSEETIEAAVDAARPVAVANAIKRARARAAKVADEAGLTIGGVQSATEVLTESDVFGPERHCREARNGGLRCRVPGFAAAQVEVTFATSETSAAPATDRVIRVIGRARVPVTPRARRSPDIRAAINRATFAAYPIAFRRARADAPQAAAASGVVLGRLLSIYQQQQPFGYDPGFGSFGAGRFCGTIRRPIVRRDRKTGRPRVVRRVRERRCFFPRSAFVALRVTYAAG